MSNYFKLKKTVDINNIIQDVKLNRSVYLPETTVEQFQSNNWLYIKIPEGFETNFAKFTVSEGVVTLSVDQDKRREYYLNRIRNHRQPLIVEADYNINKLYDAGEDDSSWKLYRQQLRDVTEPYKSDPTLLDAVNDVSLDVTWPNKP
jgi:hypothetical protein